MWGARGVCSSSFLRVDVGPASCENPHDAGHQRIMSILRDTWP
ncbi:hypothetical protein HMPREF9603_00784 [Cutibacterium acnes HL001PA1]|nr:hypothetical protein HMPREF9603_00784 [Cutibacterium acnes HL001PA1]